MIPFLVVFFAWFFQSLTGFGAGIFIIAILSLLYDPKMVVVSSALFNLLGTLGLLYQNRKGAVEPYLLFFLVLGSLPGVFLGAYFLDKVDQKTLRLLIGVFIVLIGLYDLLVNKGWLRLRFGKRMALPVGFLGGLFAGLVGMGGPPPVVFLSQQLKDPRSIKLMLNLYFTSNILLRLTFYQQMEVVRLDWDFIKAGLLGLFFGLLFGGLMSSKLPQNLYRAGVSYGVIILGFLLIILTEVSL
ncbi:MAG: sulfite exporter TauE/SafE family protein [Aquificaceae bacterium]|nr:sulfite exporter TauE/SafE family protein [Aquificaceae bacterium]MCS7196003.1 sulfite exporter TauE/SafE family protein [Aquificaceae bacterium]MDW8032499.1 sulfite exporter TauE/SafE family protein [Aquificaceae bacterium]MDW8294291.1 sulfite exporter TauE/SafE family protein [Aquificaceae bacterium]